MARKGKKKPVTLAKVATGADSLPAQFVDVDDPFSLKPGEKITVRRRLTPLADLFNRGKIDSGQKAAGELFAHMHAHAELGGARAIDYTREKVDVSGSGETLSGEQQDALDWLRRLARYPGMGEQGFRVLRAVCGEEKSVTIYAREWGMRNGGAYGVERRRTGIEGYVLHRLIEALDCLVDFEGINVKAAARGRIQASSGDNLAEFGDEYEIDRFGDWVSRKRA